MMMGLIGPAGPPAPSYDAATVAWASAVVTAGGSVGSTREGIIDTFIKALKAQSCSLGGSLWSNFDFLFVHAGENVQQATVSLVNPSTRQATNNGATFTASVGFTGNGSSTYVDLGYNAATNGVNFTKNSASMGIWDHSFSTGDWKIGSTDGSGQIGMACEPGGSGGWAHSVNDAGANEDDAGERTTLGYPPTKGFLALSRTGSSNTSVFLHLNGVSLTPALAGVASSGVPSQNMFLCLRNYFGGPNGGTTDPLSMSFAASGFSTTDMSNFYTILNALASSVGF